MDFVISVVEHWLEQENMLMDERGNIVKVGKNVFIYSLQKDTNLSVRCILVQYL